MWIIISPKHLLRQILISTQNPPQRDLIKVKNKSEIKSDLRYLVDSIQSEQRGSITRTVL